MDIGFAVKALLEGKRVARAGWHGKGMYVFMVPGEAVTVTGDHISVSPSMALRTPENTIQPGWNASTPDLLAKDWDVVD